MRKLTVTLMAVPFAALLIACGSSGGSAKSGATVAADPGTAKSTATSTAKTTAKSTAKAAGEGQAVRDGKFEFTVTKVKCGVTHVGDSIMGEKAQGQFCEVTMKVRNIGNEAQLFDDSDQYAFGADGKKFSADTMAGIDANEGDNAFLDQINPGNSVTGIVVFDIPKTAKIAKLELHDSPFSDGVTVTVK